MILMFLHLQISLSGELGDGSPNRYVAAILMLSIFYVALEHFLIYVALEHTLFMQEL